MPLYFALILLVFAWAVGTAFNTAIVYCAWNFALAPWLDKAPIPLVVAAVIGLILATLIGALRRS
jgi:hypothetical protein